MSKHTIIGIYLGSKEEDLKRWFQLLIQNDLEQAFFIKQAIIAHTRGEQISLGTVCPQGTTAPYRTSFTVSTEDIEIVNFVERLKEANIKASSYLKKVLRQYIAISNNPEQEYIPSYFSFKTTSSGFVDFGYGKTEQPNAPSSMYATNPTQVSDEKPTKAEEALVITTNSPATGNNASQVEIPPEVTTNKPNKKRKRSPLLDQV